MHFETARCDSFWCEWTLFQGYKPPDEGPSEYQSIPLNKIEDFGVHCKSWVLFPSKATLCC